jgi:type VI secretion system secreted protein Hcp
VAIPSGISAGGSQGDTFLKIDGSKMGPVKGEARDDKHQNEIDVLGWSWGMQAQTAMGAGGTSGKSVIHELKIVKRVDSASCALMSMLRNNDQVKKAVLTVRKAGESAKEYFKITIQNGRITALDVVASEGGPELAENVSFAFQKISVEYLPQGADGQLRGAMSFETEIDER